MRLVTHCPLGKTSSETKEEFLRSRQFERRHSRYTLRLFQPTRKRKNIDISRSATQKYLDEVREPSSNDLLPIHKSSTLIEIRRMARCVRHRIAQLQGRNLGLEGDPFEYLALKLDELPIEELVDQDAPEWWSVFEHKCVLNIAIASIKSPADEKYYDELVWTVNEGRQFLVDVVQKERPNLGTTILQRLYTCRSGG